MRQVIGIGTAQIGFASEEVMNFISKKIVKKKLIKKMYK
jgi:hypothetical protein